MEKTLFPETVQYHIHLPGNIIRCIRSRKPGFMVLREPKDAAISWAIYNAWPLRRALEDYIDHHLFLEPFNSELTIAPFEWFTAEPFALVKAAAAVTAKTTVCPEFVPGLLHEINTRIELHWMRRDGTVNELHVARPSTLRIALRSRCESELQNSQEVQRLLRRAEEIHTRWKKIASSAEVLV